MKIRKRPGTGAFQPLPPLPERFWNLTAEVLAAWEDLGRILEAEWAALKSGRHEDLLAVASEKRRRAERVQACEDRLAAVVERILAGCGGAPPEAQLWARLRAVLHPADLRRFEAWKARRDRRRREVLFVNERHEAWVHSRLDLARRLTGILTGGVLGRRPTYDGGGRPGSDGPRGPFRPSASRCLRGVV
ncbi:flagellar protein FlgN [Dissulfurirhabdus thermomarina]|uniref:Flagellar protein FlgN n=1 Tax=Dissulfurirhabdus thermomarina TaxID=1765737 RepID=A0A6N9TS46_DISTH|nr:flagellar protein FlgN [Dissulfurirhabdus thermomarina]NDY42267.1 flagellar protein FlgN [Dissulfurirhabdus thermomarina]NMX22772.1 flagellar protein FlgN [Dissulfurirhabdus thermomarina]